VIERYRLVDYEAAKEALERGAKENASFVRNDSGVIVDLNSKAKHLQLQFTVEDEGPSRRHGRRPSSIDPVWVRRRLRRRTSFAWNPPNRLCHA
jgi:hypothetical protein